MRFLLYVGLTLFTAWALIEFWGPTGLPFWPIMTTAAAVLTLWGIWLGRGAWVAPIAVLGAYVAMRGVMTWADDPLQEHFAFFVWLCAGLWLFFRAKWYFSAAACWGASIVYALAGPLNMPIERLAPTAVLGEIFAILALYSIGGGLYDRGLFSRSDSAFNWRVHNSLPSISSRVAKDKE